MKVVLFCGGLGMRLREYSEIIPKPMVNIGYRPILWHVMKYYAHYGHKEFILCLGYKADIIKNYFLNYNEFLSNDFVLTKGGKDLQLIHSDIDDWKITFVDTGLTSNIGQRLLAVKSYLGDDEMFLANYTDGLSNCPLPTLIETLKARGKIAIFLSTRPGISFHIVSTGENGAVKDIVDVGKSEVWINGGYFVFRKEIFDYIRPGEELVQEPFRRLIEKNEIITYRYDGFYIGMDTFKEKQLLDDMYSRGETPWEVWKTRSPR
ncbi:MAG TPA: sugar phosphate nucleotidyltransferase [Thermoanaerobaculia bacterium]|nr:sugar phosphate nucleotidyltransferase [Thermoanaerobaculia bacterium]